MLCAAPELSGNKALCPVVPQLCPRLLNDYYTSRSLSNWDVWQSFLFLTKKSNLTPLWATTRPLWISPKCMEELLSDECLKENNITSCSWNAFQLVFRSLLLCYCPFKRVSVFPGKVSAHGVGAVFGLLETHVESLVLAEGLTEKKPAFEVVRSNNIGYWRVHQRYNKKSNQARQMGAHPITLICTVCTLQKKEKPMLTTAVVASHLFWVGEKLLQCVHIHIH